MSEGMEGKTLVDMSAQMIEELNALSDAVASTSNIAEKKFKERKFPIRYNPKSKAKLESQKYEWNEDEIRKFYEDPENVSRTVYCKSVNVDELDDLGKFGYTPGFIYIEKKRYEGNKTLADQASSVGLSIGVDPGTGLGVMNHFDYFPKHKFDYQLIRQTEYPEVFAIMCDIFTKKKMGDSQKKNTLLLGRGK